MGPTSLSPRRSRARWPVIAFLAAIVPIGCFDQRGVDGPTPVGAPAPARADAGRPPSAPPPPPDAAVEAAVHPADATAGGGFEIKSIAPDLAAPEAAPAPDAGGSEAASLVPPTSPTRCEAGPALPVRARRITSGPASDDLAFDRDGHAVLFDRQDVVRLLRDTTVQRLAADVIGRRGGVLRELATGDLYIGDFERDALLVRAPDGQIRRVGRVASPMKMVHGPGGSLYVTGKTGIVSRIEASGTIREVASLPFELGGLTFSRDYKILYVGGIGNGAIHALDVSPDGTLGPARVWQGQIARAQALATDECGSVYVLSEGDTRVRRISENRRVEVVADLEVIYTWSLAFGSGKQGWSETALYVLEPAGGRLLELELGRSGAPPPPSE